MTAEKGNLSRRRFIDVLLGSGLFAWFGAVVYPIIGYLLPPPGAEAKVSRVKVPKLLPEFPENSGLVFRFGTKPAIVVRSPAGEFSAFFATCTHLDCTVQYDAKQASIWCACHNGRFDLNGKNISGPPPKPLSPLDIRVVGEEIYVSRPTA
jgi:cytochrome b6-f complex iron-sulfur subunit